MNKMAGRTPGAQETWQETPSHSVLHNYASTLPWIDIYTANTAFPLPPLALHPLSSPSPRYALKIAPAHGVGRPIPRTPWQWRSPGMDFGGDGIARREELETDWSAGEAWKAKGGEERRETLICTATAYSTLYPAGTSVASLCLPLSITSHTRLRLSYPSIPLLSTHTRTRQFERPRGRPAILTSDATVPVGHAGSSFSF